MKILFVCSGNCSRSPMAEAYFRHLCKQNNLFEDVTCMSTGIKVQEESVFSPEAQEVMVSLGLTLKNHTPKQITEEMIDEETTVIVMTAKHAAAVKKQFPQLAKEGRVRLLFSFLDNDNDVENPVAEDLQTYQQCFLGMMPALSELTDRIMRSLA